MMRADACRPDNRRLNAVSETPIGYRVVHMPFHRVEWLFLVVNVRMGKQTSHRY